ncbi:MAG: hypothetical protein M9924_21210 [Rhizobiaceae bacterium]|nr:hypothetical protein [Rhizobiaceae bacterium]
MSRRLPLSLSKERIITMASNTLTPLENSLRNAYIATSTRSSDMARIPDIIETKAQVDTVVDAFFATGDDAVFTRHIKAMSDEHDRSSIAIMRGSGNELDPMCELLSLVLGRKIIAVEDVIAYNARYSDWKKSEAA